MRRWTQVFGAIAAVLALAGCGGSTPAGAQPAATGQASGQATVPASAAADPHTSWDTSALPDPCRTITNTEIAGVVGSTVNPGMRLESWPPLCQFVLDQQQRELLYVSDDSGPTGRQDYDRKRSDSAATQPVDGIGDQAYWQPDFTSLHVLNGATHIFVAFAGPVPPGDAKEKAIALARLILPRTKA